MTMKSGYFFVSLEKEVDRLKNRKSGVYSGVVLNEDFEQMTGIKMMGGINLNSYQ
jgi:hypothetical protein